MSNFVLSRFTPQCFAGINGSENQRLFVATIKDHLVGFVTIDLDSSCGDNLDCGYEIIPLYVQEYFLGRGVCAELMKYVEIYSAQNSG